MDYKKLSRVADSKIKDSNEDETFTWLDLREDILKEKPGESFGLPGGWITIYGLNEETGEFEFGFESNNSGTEDLYSVESVDKNPEKADIFFDGAWDD